MLSFRYAINAMLALAVTVWSPLLLAAEQLRSVSIPLPIKKSKEVDVPKVDFKRVEVTPVKTDNEIVFTIRNHFTRELKPVLTSRMKLLNTCSEKRPLQKVSLRQHSYRSAGVGRMTCDRMPLSLEYWLFFQSHFPRCINKTLKQYELPTADLMIAHSWLIFMHKGSARRQKLSLHAAGRAIDIHSVDVFFDLEKSGKIKIKEGTHDAIYQVTGGDLPRELPNFFGIFRECWTEALVQKRQCRKWKSRPHRGSVGSEDPYHTKHIHLSFPFCPKNSNFLGA